MGFYEEYMCSFVQCNVIKGSRAWKGIVEKLQRRLCLGMMEDVVPADVNEGQLAVYAVDDDGELHRFVVGLGCFVNPEFLRLLALAAEEFGLGRDGALLIPCQPGDLERILGQAEEFGLGRDGALLILCQPGDLERILGQD